MISHVYLSYRTEEQGSVDAITQHLLNNGIVALPIDRDLPDRNVDALVVVVGSSGIEPEHLDDIARAIECSSMLLVAYLGDADLPDTAPTPVRSAPSVRLTSTEEAACITLVDLLRQDTSGPADGASEENVSTPDEEASAPKDVSAPEAGDDEDEEAEMFSSPLGKPLGIEGTNSKARSSEVFLGVASQQDVYADSEFVARFSAYTEEFRETVAEVFEKEAPTAKPALDLHSTRWKIGTKVTVSLSARGLNVDNSPQQFEWNGKWSMLRFDVEVPPNRSPGTVALKFNVIIEGITVAALRPEIEVHSGKPTGSKPSPISDEEQRFPKTAFASYSTDDRAIVLNRVRSLQILTDIDVFVDCLSIRPAQRWRDELAEQLLSRELFLLFWSRNAAESKWVDWEWRKILKTKGLDAVQPHPLEPADLAPPPRELADLQFGTAYETFMVSCNSNEDE